MEYEKRKQRASTYLGVAGKIPPQAQDFEEGILGTILSDSDSLIDIEGFLKPEHFYNEGHKKIFEAIITLSSKNNPIDTLTVAEQLRKSELLEMVGGNYFLVTLSQKNLKEGRSIEYHAKVIIQKFMQRKAIQTAQETIQEAYRDDVDIFNLIEKNQNHLSDILNDTNSKEPVNLDYLFKEAVAELSMPKKEGITGVPSGFTDLDAITGGWQPSDLIIIAARPAMGKTAFALKCARNAAVIGKKKVVVFSLEMSSMQLTFRLLSDETGIHMDKIKKNNLNDTDFLNMHSKMIDLAKVSLKIDDTSALNIIEFRAKCRRLKAKYGLDMILIDYLQLMHPGESDKFSSRDTDIGKITGALKSVAKDLNVPVVALSQLSRSVDSRPSKRPVLSDLRESGNIEQDADMVLFLYRPEYYGITKDHRGNSTIGLAEVIIAKNRNGICDTINTDFNGSYMRFKDWVPAPTASAAKLELQKDENVDLFTSLVAKDDGDIPF